MFQGSIIAAPADPEDLHGLRARISHETAGDYGRFRRSLKPHFGIVKRDIALGYVVLGLTLIVAGRAEGLGAGLFSAALGAIVIGYAVAYLQLFIHEAAHFNLAADRRRNDRLANWLICWQVGTSIDSYRRTHAEHHRSLGEDGDTEVSYRHPLSVRFMIEMATGIHALRVFATRKAQKNGKRNGASARPLLIGASIHFTLVALLVLAGAWPAALAWIMGMGSVYPLFATLRQLIEHRPLAGQTRAGAVTRLFGHDIFSRTFGGAGFNRHLLHHLEPQISYTRFKEFEDYLMQTSARDALDARRSSYTRTFADLIRDSRNA